MSKDTPKRLTPDQLERVTDYIHANLGNTRLTIEHLARTIGISEFHFARLFKQATGQAPHQYILHYRLQMVKTLLSTTEMLLSDIAHQCGFADHSHMTREFKRATGHTPSEWRKRASFWK